MNVFDRIIQDHEKQRQLMETLTGTEGDSATRETAFRDFRAEYRAHATAEEQVFYASLMEHPDGTDKARHSVAEHKETLELLEKLNDTDMSSPAWLSTMKKVRHDNLHHIEEEEEEVFPHARRVLKKKAIEHMAKEFDERKKTEMSG